VSTREETDETQILAALLGVAEMAGDLTDPEELLAAIVRITPVLVRVDRCAILAYDKHTREFHTLASFGPGGKPTPFEGLRIQVADIPRLAHRLVSLRLPALLKESSKEGMLPPFLQTRLGVSAGLVMPLACRGRFLGALWLDDTRAPHLFTSTEINVVQGIATQLAAALNVAELVGKLDLERQRFEALVGVLTDGLLIVDRELRMVHVDAGAEALLGWQSSEIRGRRFYEVFQITEAEASVAWTKDRGGPAPTAKDLILRARNGVEVRCTIQPIFVRDAVGDVSQVLYTLRKAPGTKTYAERLMEALVEVPPATRAAPPE
jgi:PAS domain S-box-containing protein